MFNSAPFTAALWRLPFFVGVVAGSGIRHRNGGDISAPLAQFRTRFTATSASVHHPPRTPFVEHVVTSREEGRAASINSHTKALSTEIGDSLELDPHHHDKSANFPPLSRCNERSSVDRPCALSWRHGTSFFSSIPITIIELFFMLTLCLYLCSPILFVFPIGIFICYLLLSLFLALLCKCGSNQFALRSVGHKKGAAPLRAVK